MMEHLVETLELDMEESNELNFKINVEGASASPAKVRLVCERDDIAYMFNGHGTSEDGVVQFIMPVMKDKISEGTCNARVEVLIENRYFAPVQFQINFKKAVKVVAEAIQVRSINQKNDIKVTAAPIIAKKPAEGPKPIVIERVTQQNIASTSLKERYEQKQGKSAKPQMSEDDYFKGLARKFVNLKLDK